MEETAVTTVSEYFDYDPTTYSDELREIISQASKLAEQSAENNQTLVSISDNLQTIIQKDDLIICGMFCIACFLGILSGLIFSLTLMGR